VFPLLGEAKSLVPGNRLRGILDAQNRNDLLLHAAILADR